MTTEESAVTLADIDKAVAEVRAQRPDWRLGQAYFNVVATLVPGCGDAVRGMQVDPFHRDDLVPDFRAFVANWLGDPARCYECDRPTVCPECHICPYCSGDGHVEGCSREGDEYTVEQRAAIYALNLPSKD